MKRHPDAPPRSAVWVLERVVRNRAARLGLAGDLHERFLERRRTQAQWRCAVWYWRQVLAAGGRYGLEISRHGLERSRLSGRPASTMTSLVRDVLYAFRVLRRAPGVAAVAVLTLALGIGLPTVMFAVVHGVLQDLPVERPDRLVQVWRTDLSRGSRRTDATHRDYAEWRGAARSFEGLAAFNTEDVTLSGGEQRPVRRDAAFVSTNVFDVLGVQPTLGRGFAPEDASPRSARAVIVSHAVWQARFAGAAEVLGRTLVVDGTPHTVIGVMPERFGFPTGEGLWIPLSLSLDLPRGDSPTAVVFGRLADGVSLDAARVEMRTIAARLAAEHPETNGATGAGVTSFRGGQVGAVLRRGLYTMLGAVSFVLLVACANVANLLLARAVHRRQEIAVRTALGARRRSVIAQFLTEAFVIAALGGAMGTLLAWGGTRVANGALGAVIDAPWITIRVDGTVLLFVAAVVAAGAMLAGLLPAIQASGTVTHTALADEARSGPGLRLGRFSRGLVIAEIALSCALLVVSGLLIKGVLALRGIDLGMPMDEIVTGEVELPREVYASAESRVRFFEELEGSVAAIPGVRAVALMSDIPGTIGFRLPVSVDGVAASDDPSSRVAGLTVTPNFLDLLDAPLLQGRGFTAQDRAGSELAMLVNQSFAEQFVPSGSPVGRTVRWGPLEGVVVGVVPDLFMGSLDRADPNGPGIYLPLAQRTNVSMQLLVRAAGDPLGVTGQIRDALEALDPNLALTNVDRADRLIAQGTVVFEVFGRLFLVFGLAALFLASIGLYGVMAFTVSRRTREWGVRMALGARSREVVGLVLRQAAVQIAVGLGAGLVIAGALSVPLSNFFYQVQPWDRTIFTIIAVVLSVTGLVSTYLPARRATRVDPVEALR